MLRGRRRRSRLARRHHLATDEGWLYLDAILDTYSRRVVGWATSESLERDFVVEALERALAARRPDEGLLHHSDRGTQYTSAEYRERLAAARDERKGCTPRHGRPADLASA